MGCHSRGVPLLLGLFLCIFNRNKFISGAFVPRNPFLKRSWFRVAFRGGLKAEAPNECPTVIRAQNCRKFRPHSMQAHNLKTCEMFMATPLVIFFCKLGLLLYSCIYYYELNIQCSYNSVFFPIRWPRQCDFCSLLVHPPPGNNHQGKLLCSLWCVGDGK